jgi:hypothetical protein
MDTAIGIFREPRAARDAAQHVHRSIPGARVRVFTSPECAAALQDVPADDTEAPGVGPAVGGVVGAAAGAAIASVLAPPAGLPAVIALATGALLGFGGGAAVGDRLEEHLDIGVSRDELFIYEDALQQGRALVVAQVDHPDATDAARRLLAAAGAESVDAAREQWWVGLRDAEAGEYEAEGRDFASDEPFFRSGFEAALAAQDGEEPDGAAARRLGTRVTDAGAVAAFERGWRRGSLYRERMLVLAVTRPTAVREASEP